MRNLVIALLLTAGVAIAFGGCATIAGAALHGKRSVYLMDGPPDMEAFVNGKRLVLLVEGALPPEAVDPSRTPPDTCRLFTRYVMLPYKHDVTIDLYSPASGRKASVLLRAKPQGAFIACDILFTAGLGLLIDIPTKNHKMLQPLYVDARAVFDNQPRSEWRSKKVMRQAAARAATLRHYYDVYQGF